MRHTTTYEYKIIRAQMSGYLEQGAGLLNLQDMVNILSIEGWQPLGGAFKDDYGTWCQAMTRQLVQSEAFSSMALKEASVD